MAEVGSPEWIAALAASIEHVDAGDVDVTVLHRVSGGPAWLVQAGGGVVRVAPAAPDDHADVTFSWEAADAESVAAGTTTPLAVFQAGRLRVGGDLRRLTGATELFAAFPGVPV